MNLGGVMTALVTPFINGKIDEEGFVENIKRQLNAKVHGLVISATTGEAATLIPVEQETLISLAVKANQGQAYVVVGTGTQATETTIEKSLKAQELGADAVLVVTPFYNRPSQEGIYQHFKALSKELSIPIIAYNNPSRTGCTIESLTWGEIAKLPQIVGLKESSGDISKVSDFIAHGGTKAVLAGDDSMALPIMAIGGQGIISTLSNLCPERMIALFDAIEQNNYLLAREIHYQLLPLFKGMGFETNPIPIKAAMNLCGLPAGPCRLPLAEMQSAHREALKELLIDAGLPVLQASST